jgi:hypothetical protein
MVLCAFVGRIFLAAESREVNLIELKIMVFLTRLDFVVESADTFDQP